MRTGRPVKNIDLEKLKNLMSFFPSLDETAGWFNCSPDTISRLIKDEFGLTFAEFRSRFMARTKINLKRIAIQKALEGNDKLLMHCLRTLTNMDDRQNLKPVPSDLTAVELVSEAQEILSQLN